MPIARVRWLPLLETPFLENHGVQKSGRFNELQKSANNVSKNLFKNVYSFTLG